MACHATGGARARRAMIWAVFSDVSDPEQEIPAVGRGRDGRGRASGAPGTACGTPDAATGARPPGRCRSPICPPEACGSLQQRHLRAIALTGARRAPPLFAAVAGAHRAVVGGRRWRANRRPWCFVAAGPFPLRRAVPGCPGRASAVRRSRPPCAARSAGIARYCGWAGPDRAITGRASRALRAACQCPINATSSRSMANTCASCVPSARSAAASCIR